MSGSVTVPGPNNTTITQTFSNSFNSTLAQNIADALAAASKADDLFIATVGGGGTFPTNTSGKIGELVVESGFTGSVNVPAGANYAFLVDNSAGPDTIFGSPGLSIMGGGGIHTIIDPAVITLGDTASGSTNNVTVTGVGDDVAVGNGTNTLTGTGSGTMSGGFGINTFVESGGASYLINSQGFQDTIRAGDGATTVNSNGPGAVVSGGGGALFANLAGTGATLTGGGGAVSATVSGDSSLVIGGGGALGASVSGTGDTIVGGGAVGSVTLSGSKALVVDSVAAMSVLDKGTADTIDAGQSFTSVTAPGGSFVQGGSGPLNFVGGSGPSTIVGATGGSTVFGGTGLTSIIGGPGGATTYVNTTPGGLFYAAGKGSETLDASLSKGSSTVYGGADATGRNLLIGGPNADFINAGASSDTMVGGGGANWFYVFKAAVGPAANEVISDFSAIDTLALVGYGPDAGANAIAGATTANGSTTITLSDNTKITFTGVTNPASLTGHISSF
jgi:hypothetical protein